MANEIRIEEYSAKRNNGDWEIYPNKPIAVQFLDQSGTVQTSSALNDATDFVRIINLHTAAEVVAVHDSGFTLTANTGTYLPEDGKANIIELTVARGQSNLVSAINA